MEHGMYEAGEKVRLKSWKQLVMEFGLVDNRNIIIRKGYCVNHRQDMHINHKYIDRVAVIKSSSPTFYDRHFEWYYITNIEGKFRTWILGELIDSLVDNYIKSFPIKNRFEILDL